VVFSNVLCGLSGAKVTRPSTFRSCQHGYAVKSALKAEDGLLYPLEKAFFFLPKPPTLILYEEIEYVLFERHGAGGVNISSQYFDLLVKLKNDQEHLFSNIQRIEYQNLFSFIRYLPFLLIYFITFIISVIFGFLNCWIIHAYITHLQAFILTVYFNKVNMD